MAKFCALKTFTWFEKSCQSPNLSATKFLCFFATECHKKRIATLFRGLLWSICRGEVIFIRFCLGFLPVLRQAKLLFSRALRGRILAIVGKVTKSFLLDKPFCEIAPEQIQWNLKNYNFSAADDLRLKNWLLLLTIQVCELCRELSLNFDEKMVDWLS